MFYRVKSLGRLDLERKNKEIIASAYHRWTQGEGNFFDVLADDAVWTVMGSGPSAVTTCSKQEYIDRMVRPMAARFAVPLRPTVRGVWAEGDTVIVRWSGDAVRNDDQPYHNEYAWFFRMRDGKAVEVTAFFDLPAYDAVLDRVRPKGSSYEDQ